MTQETLRATITRWRNHPYIRVFALLLLTVSLFVGLSALSWCDGCDFKCSCTTETVRRDPYEIGGSARIITAGYVYVGETVRQHLHFYGYGPVTHVTVIYTPPPGVTNLEFSNPQPTRQLADGSYVWENLPVDPTRPNEWKVELSSSHTAPQVPPNLVWTSVTSTLSVRAGQYQDTASQHYNVFQGHRLAAEPLATLSRAEAPVQVQPQAADYYVWQAQTWGAPPGVDLTTDVCQEWVDLLESEDVFLAARFPLLDATPPYTESYRLPVVFSNQYRPMLSLLDERHYPFTTLLMTTLEYKPEYHTFLNNELPRADNERWFAMGLRANSALTCPSGLNIPAGDWDVKTDAWLDFGGDKTDCANCILPVYYCYEGQDAPTIPPVALGALGMAATTYQGWGITCIGPHLLWLADQSTANPSFHIHIAGTATILPSETVTFTHVLFNLGRSRVSVNLSVTSTLSIAWGMYDTSDPPAPITQPIQLGVRGMPDDPPSQFEFQVVGNVPAGAQGAHTLYVTAKNAANAAQKTQTTDLLWVGEWEPPPPFKVYFPVMAVKRP